MAGQVNELETVNPASIGLSAARLSKLTETLRRWVGEGVAPGFVALIARHGKVGYFESVGKRDLETGAPMERDDIFRIYSMSKPVTAAAVMVLLEEGCFRLDDPVSEYIPEFAHTKVFAGEAPEGMALADVDRPMTIRHLLTHTSGLTYGDPTGGPVDRAYAQAEILRGDRSLAENVAALAALPLAFQPGERWNYGVSIDVLGRLVEAVSGQRFGAFLENRLFRPLEMPDTGFQVPPANASRLAPAYGAGEDGGLRRLSWVSEHDQTEVLESGGGGLVSTASDYYRFAQMLLGGGRVDGVRVLSRKSVELMTAPQSYQDGTPIRVSPTWSFSKGYTMALGVRTLVSVADLGLPGSVGSYNWEGLASTAFWVDPREDLLAILMLQRVPTYGPPTELFRPLVYAALDD